MDSSKTLQHEILKALVSTTRSATRISGADVTFQRSLNPEIGSLLDVQNARLLRLAQRLIENAAASTNAVGSKLSDVEAVDTNWRAVVDVIDSLLEKADISLDEYTGVVKRLSPERDLVKAKLRPSIAEQHAISKPQLKFENVPTNDESGGFRPLISSKPHALVPLEDCLRTFKDYNEREQYPHPYQSEIENYDYPSVVYNFAEPQEPLPFESTTAIFVDTPEALAMMLAELKTAKEIAIDVEHHDNRSYIGLVSLIQISTRQQDWIVDTLKPWRRKLECLNEVFTDPGILKILHGAFMDIVWLQRDLGLYIVGLFDTYHAARSLGYPSASLAYLLERFVNFKAQKQYQMADWRTRPLSKELFEYARADTHFLLYIWDNMRNELVEKSDFSDPGKNKVQDVLQNSRTTALQRYEHPIYDSKLGLGPIGWYKLISRTPVQFSPQQFSVFRVVHQWRDALSRKEDESPFYIMSNHALFSIAREMPADKAALFSTVKHVSHLIKSKADELVKLVAEARSEGTTGPELNDVLKKIADLREARWAKPQAPERSALLHTAHATQAASTVSNVVKPAVRAPESRFWGKVWHARSTAEQRRMPAMSIDFPLPLPPLTAEISVDTASVVDPPFSANPSPNFIPKEERPAADERVDVFVIKQLDGRKRKRSEAPAQQTSIEQDPEPITDDEIMLDANGDSEEATRRREKAARKAARKQKKKERAAQTAALNYEDEPVFDYSNAPSVLHAQDREVKKKEKNNNKRKSGVFDPFKGMYDAPKGLPRAQREMPGRSRTFKS